MKTSRSIELAIQIEELSNLIITCRELEKKQSKLKSHIKQVMAEMDTKILRAGDNLAIITDRTRAGLDMEALRNFVGVEKMKAFETKADYQIFEIKKA